MKYISQKHLKSTFREISSISRLFLKSKVGWWKGNRDRKSVLENKKAKREFDRTLEPEPQLNENALGANWKSYGYPFYLIPMISAWSRENGAVRHPFESKFQTNINKTEIFPNNNYSSRCSRRNSFSVKPVQSLGYPTPFRTYSKDCFQPFPKIRETVKFSAATREVPLFKISNHFSSHLKIP